MQLESGIFCRNDSFPLEVRRCPRVVRRCPRLFPPTRRASAFKRNSGQARRRAPAAPPALTLTLTLTLIPSADDLTVHNAKAALRKRYPDDEKRYNKAVAIYEGQDCARAAGEVAKAGCRGLALRFWVTRLLPRRPRNLPGVG